MAMKANEVEYTDVLIDLSNYLKSYYKEDVIIIIDEYDTPIQEGYLSGYLDEILNFMKSMLVKGFKDNNSLKRGILTGIMKAAKESIFSDFNNPVVSTVLSNDYKDKFGFTEEEVIDALKYYDLEGKIEETKKWYNGYIFGTDTVIYNPWSIVNFLNTPSNGFKSYWVNISSNSLIKEILQLDKAEGKKTIESLLEKKRVSKPLLENIVYQSITTNPDSAWSFLLHAGYLKASNRTEVSEGEFKYDLEIPNTEVRLIYKSILGSYFLEDVKTSNEMKEFTNSLLKEDFETFEIILRELYFKYVSVHDAGVKELSELNLGDQKERQENFHHGFILGLLMYATSKYEIYSNREYGLGRPDIVLMPKDKTNAVYLFEFKWSSTKSKKTLEFLLESAINQISEKKYVEGIKSVHNTDNIVTVAVGFKGKELEMKISK